MNKIDSLTIIFRDSKLKPDFQNIKTSLDDSYKKFLTEHKTYLINFIEKHNNSIASIIAISLVVLSMLIYLLYILPIVSSFTYYYLLQFITIYYLPLIFITRYIIEEL